METPLVRKTAGVVGQSSCSVWLVEEGKREREGGGGGAKLAMQFHNHTDGS